MSERRPHWTDDLIEAVYAELPAKKYQARRRAADGQVRRESFADRDRTTLRWRERDE